MDVHSPDSQLYNRGAEESLLGAIIINPGAYLDVVDQVQANDFYVHSHRFIWQAIARLNERQQPLDLLTLTEELGSAGRLEEIGGPGYLTGLVAEVPSSLNVGAYAEIVRRHSIQRQMLQAANQIAELAHRRQISTEEALNEASRLIDGLAAGVDSGRAVMFGQALSDEFDRLQAAAQSTQPVGINTGLTDLDHLLGGLQPSDMVVVAARPGVGKTSFLCGMAKSIAAQAKRVLFFSLEMSTSQLIQRILAMHTGISTQALRLGQLNDQDWIKLAEALEALADLPLVIDDAGSLSPAQLRARTQRIAARYGGLDLVMVDYLQLMNGGGRRFSNRQEEVSYISSQIKAIAKEAGIPVLVAAQLSRAVEQRGSKVPVLSDLRESGAIEQDADTVMFIHRPQDAAMPGATELVVAKHRHGPTGLINLLFQAERTQFVSAQIQRTTL